MKLVLASILSLSIIVTANGIQTRRQTRRPVPQPEKKNAATAPARPGGYSDSPPDATAPNLPPGYRGNNLAAVYKVLAARKQAAVKGEFETTAAFNARVQAEAAKPLVGSLTPGGLFAFTVSGVESAYDADNQNLRARVKVTKAWEGYGVASKKMAVAWNFDIRDKSNYTGTNAYGASVEVDSTVADSYEIVSENYSTFTVEKVLNDYYKKEQARESDEDKKIRERMKAIGMPDIYEEMKESYLFADLQMDAHTAMKTKPVLRALIICRLAEPPVIESTTYNKPTISDPTEVLVRNYMLNVEPREIWFYDISTGKILAKLSPGATPAAAEQKDAAKPDEPVHKALITFKPEPSYTPQAKADAVQGVVRLRIILQADGTVGIVEVVKGLPDGLTEKAIEAAKQIRFVPARKGDQAISQTVTVEYNFNNY